MDSKIEFSPCHWNCCQDDLEEDKLVSWDFTTLNLIQLIRWRKQTSKLKRSLWDLNSQPTDYQSNIISTTYDILNIIVFTYLFYTWDMTVRAPSHSPRLHPHLLPAVTLWTCWSVGMRHCDPFSGMRVKVRSIRLHRTLNVLFTPVILRREQLREIFSPRNHKKLVNYPSWKISVKVKVGQIASSLVQYNPLLSE